MQTDTHGSDLPLGKSHTRPPSPAPELLTRSDVQSYASCFEGLGYPKSTSWEDDQCKATVIEGYIESSNWGGQCVRPSSLVDGR